jgi:F-type H+-transporting ATPase subunit b
MRVPVRHIWTTAIAFALVAVVAGSSAAQQAQPEHATTTQSNAAAAVEPTQPPAADAHQAPAAGQHEGAPAAGEASEAAAEHGSQWMPTIARLFNFALLAGTLFYLLRSPLALYLANRSTQIRERLVKARDMRSAAAAEQEAVARKMQSLPAELDALRKAGAEEVAAEESRLRHTADAERDRLLEMTRRDISVQLRFAERTLIRRAADLAVDVAAARVKTTITDADQIRLVDRYLLQVGK